MIQQEMGNNAEDCRAGQNEVRRGSGNVYGKAQQVDHKWHMDNAAANTEDARDKTDAKAGRDTNPLVELKASGKVHEVHRRFVHGVPEHDAGHAENEQAIVEIKLWPAEFVHDVGTDKGSRQSGQCKGHRCAEKDAFLTDIGKGTRDGVRENDHQRCPGNLRRRMEVGIETAIRHKEDKDWNTDKPTADSDQGAKGTDEKSQQQEK